MRRNGCQRQRIRDRSVFARLARGLEKEQLAHRLERRREKRRPLEKPCIRGGKTQGWFCESKRTRRQRLQQSLRQNGAGRNQKSP